MRALAIVGLLLIVLGVVGLAVGHFSFTTNKQVANVGPIQASVAERHTVDVPDIAGIAAVVAGVVLVFIGRRTA